MTEIDDPSILRFVDQALLSLLYLFSTDVRSLVFTWRLLNAEEKEITRAANLIKFVNIHWQVHLN